MVQKEDINVVFKPPLETLRERFKRRLDELGGGTGKGFSIPNKKASIFLDRWVQQNLRRSGENVGGWPDFKRGGRWMKKKGIDTSAKLLMDTGRLRLSFMPFFDSHDAGIGSDLAYSIYHQKGTKNVPQRRLLPLHEEVRPDLFRIYSVHVAGLTRKKL